MACAVRPLDLETLGLAIGSPAYAAPEQANGSPATPESDRYSLDVLACVLLTGRPPFIGSSALAILLDQIVKQPPSPRMLHSQVPEAAAWAVLAMQANDPVRGCVSGAAFIEALRDPDSGQCGGLRRFLMSAAISNMPIPV